MARRRKQRRCPHGGAWHWKQTDCWYYTLPGCKKRVPLFDEEGQRIRGLENRQRAERALAQARVAGALNGTSVPSDEPWLVARVCSEYLQYCERGLAAGSISQSHRDGAIAYLNDFCAYCGALPVAELKKGHVQEWLESHTGWRSSATHRGVLSIVLAAFNRADDMFDVPNPLKGLKKPTSQPRLNSLSAEDEQALYQATDERFGQFLFAAIYTGLRPYSELAKLKAEDVEVTDRGMMWRVYASKTDKTRKIPVQDPVAQLTRRLLKSAPKGSGRPLFRNSRDKPWQKTAGVVRFLAIKKKLGWNNDPVKQKYSSYTCRHTFAHRMLSGFWNKAELLGDAPKVAFDHYGKEWGQHYQDPLWAAIGSGKHSKDVKRQTAPARKPAGKTKRQRVA